MDRLTLAVILFAAAAILAGFALWRERPVKPRSARNDYMATRRGATTYTGRRAGDLCADPDCWRASRSHTRADCGNVYVTAGEWKPKPEPTGYPLSGAETRLNAPHLYGLDSFAARLAQEPIFSPTPIRSHQDVPLCRDRSHTGWPGDRAACAECRIEDATDTAIATATAEIGG